MPIHLKNILEAEPNGRSPKWCTVVLGDGQSFDIELCPPDFTARMRDAERGSHSIHRVTATVKNWRGVLDDENREIVFNRYQLIAILEANPKALATVMEAVDRLFVVGV